MKISKRSWHYRLLKAFEPINGLNSEKELYPRSLCLYFWEVVGTLLFKVPMILVVLLCVSPFFLGYLLLYYPIRGLDRKITEWKLARRGRPPEQPKKGPGLFAAWLKAKKDKVCPILEWTEE